MPELYALAQRGQEHRLGYLGNRQASQVVQQDSAQRAASQSLRLVHA
jgi:hypothetical protein